MANVIPLKLEFDGEGDPSGIAQFQTGDTVDASSLNVTSLDLTSLSATNVTVAVDLGVSSNIKTNASAITVSSCPVPPPWSFVEVTADDGQNTATGYYFASGSSQAKNEISADHITWDSSESYFTIANAGYYEFNMQGSFIVGSSPTTITLSIVESTGLGQTEVEKIDKVQTVRTNMQPHNGNICWLGYVEAAKNFTCKIDGNATVVMQKGSTFTCKRIN